MPWNGGIPGGGLYDDGFLGGVGMPGIEAGITPEATIGTSDRAMPGDRWLDHVLRRPGALEPPGTYHPGITSPTYLDASGQVTRAPAPVPPPTFIPQVGPQAGGGGGGVVGFGSSSTQPGTADEVTADYLKYKKYIPGLANVQRPDQTTGNVGLNMTIDSGQKFAAAKRAEADIEKEQLGQLADNETSRVNKLDDSRLQEESAYAGRTKQIAELEDGRKKDEKWLRDNPNVDPYKTFTTNAGAGIMALLGSALMATGAAIGKDSSLDWTKQVEGMLGREADAQMRLINNKRWSVTEAGQNIKRITEGSNDAYEARMRIVNQGLAALNAKAEAIKHTTESKLVHQRAEEVIASNNQAIAKNIMDAALRREGIQGQLGAAQLMASAQSQGNMVNLFTGLAGTNVTKNAQFQKLIQELQKPSLDQVRKLRESYGRAESAGDIFYRLLKAGKVSGQPLEDAASNYVTALRQYYTNKEGTMGERESVRSYTFPQSGKDLISRFERYGLEDVLETRHMLERSVNDRERHILTNQFSPIPATGSIYQGTAEP